MAKVEIQLGRKYEDKITGFVGIATSLHEHMNGMVQVGLEPRVDKDGKHVKATMFDVAQLIDLEAKKKVKPARAGGPTRERP